MLTCSFSIHSEFFFVVAVGEFNDRIVYCSFEYLFSDKAVPFRFVRVEEHSCSILNFITLITVLRIACYVSCIRYVPACIRCLYAVNGFRKLDRNVLLVLSLGKIIFLKLCIVLCEYNFLFTFTKLT